MSNIYTPEDFNYETAKVGDLVNPEVVNNARNVLPPAWNTYDCVQMGEPITMMKNEDGFLKCVYHTFRRKTCEAWEYRGLCFYKGKEL